MPLPRRLRLLAFAASVLAVAACADQTVLRTADGPGVRVIPAGAPVYVSVPTDGAYRGEVQPGSGAVTAGIVAAAFAARMPAVRLGTAHASRDEALQAARATGARYLIEPRILHWENQTAVTSFAADKATVRLTVLDTRTGTIVDSGEIVGHGAWTKSGDTLPQDLLPVPAAYYADRLVEG